MKSGQELQELVQTLERVTVDAPNMVIESPKRLRDKDTGKLREHDVVLSFAMKHHTLIVAIECRDRSRKVGVPEVEAFKNKCDRTGVHRGVIVSSLGFTNTALLKAESMDIECFGLDEIERFDWCDAPGVQCRTREILDANFTIYPSHPVSGRPTIFDDQGQPLDEDRLRAVAIHCLDSRPTELAIEQDDAAINTAVESRFMDSAPVAWHVINDDGERVTLDRIEIVLRYRINVKLVPFRFRQYTDRGKDKEIYTAAMASIEAAGVQGDILLHKVEGEHIEVLFVPKGSSIPSILR